MNRDRKQLPELNSTGGRQNQMTYDGWNGPLDGILNTAYNLPRGAGNPELISKAFAAAYSS